MISIDEAFKKFKSRLELTDREKEDASRRQQDIRAYLDSKFHIEHDFLTGSYKRWTKTKPLKDVDIFCVLHDDERHYRDKHPSVLLGDVEGVIADKYGRDNVSCQRRSVSVSFGVKVVDDDTDGKVMSFDVVPAFTKDDYYEIPDAATSELWTKTNPRIHAEKATASNKAFSGEWCGMVRMIKKWNRHHDKPVKPSFLLEVMAHELLRPPFGGDYRRELKAFFASAADRIGEVWPEPAGLGPPVSDGMNAAERQMAKKALLEAEENVTYAIRLANQNKNGDALRVWRDSIFGPLFPLS
jgi:Second Messenger Oligonucleotide or Dinucleotide Synthetase domain